MDINLLKASLATAEKKVADLTASVATHEASIIDLTAERDAATALVTEAGENSLVEKAAADAVNAKLETVTADLAALKVEGEALKSDFEKKVSEAADNKAKDLLVAKLADAGEDINLGDAKTEGAQGGGDEKSNLTGMARAEAAVAGVIG